MFAAAAERNKSVIADVLANYIPSAACKILEIASGTGQHVVHFGQRFKTVTFQPTDIEQGHIDSISSQIKNTGVDNVKEPFLLDITKSIKELNHPFIAQESLDIILNSNMIHISPWQTAVGLFDTAGKLLKSKGILFMYGPFRLHGNLTPESNIRFDQSLKSRDSSWGIRDVDDLDKLASENGLKREAMVDMPANNKCIIFRKAT